MTMTVIVQIRYTKNKFNMMQLDSNYDLQHFEN